MRRLRIPLLAAAVLSATACGTPDPLPVRDLAIRSVEPPTVFLEGTDTVSLTTENGCGAERISITVGGVAVTQLQATDRDHYTFTAPADTTLTAAAVKEVQVACSAPPDATFSYGKSAAKAELVYDPALEPAPEIESHFPVGTVSVLAKMTVTFTRPIDASTVTTASFGIEHVDGTITHDETGRTFTFTPTEGLDWDYEYTARVTTAVRSKLAGKALKPTLAATGSAPDPLLDAWTFETSCGCEHSPFEKAATWCSQSTGASPRLHHTGRMLMDADDSPANATLDFRFELFESDSGSVLEEAVWSEEKTLTVVDGEYEAVLGESVAIPAELTGRPLWLEVAIDDSAFPPRVAVEAGPVWCD